MPPAETPPPIHFSIPAPEQSVDYDRLIGVILALENTPWKKPGGALCFMPESWKEDAGTLPYRLASNPAQAVIIAKIRLARFAAICSRHRIRWTPTTALDAWRWGIREAMHRARIHSPSGYAVRGTNLFEDKTFKPATP
jgi:hypothetical protein